VNLLKPLFRSHSTAIETGEPTQVVNACASLRYEGPIGAPLNGSVKNGSKKTRGEAIMHSTCRRHACGLGDARAGDV
jgi:hypothetical protein